MWSWLKKHWTTLATIGCTVAAPALLPINPLISTAVGAICVAVSQNRNAKK